MAITVKHTKVSIIADASDTSLVRPSDWNADHSLTGTVPVENGGTAASTSAGGLNNLLPSQTGNNGKVLATDGTNATWTTSGSGDVVGPASATNHAISRFDTTTGKLIQNSLVTIDDTGYISSPVDASISGLTVGKGGNAIATNTAMGVGVLSNNTTGSNNTASGTQALSANTTGSNNTASGQAALINNTTGNNNTASGYQSLQSNTTASRNTAVGYQTLFNNTTASSNTAIGYQAGYSIQTIPFLTAVGYRAGYLKTGADSYGSTFLGTYAGFLTTTGADNSFVGTNAGWANTTGTYNTTLGAASLTTNTTGSNNTAIGFQSLLANTTASSNTAVGYQSLQSNTTASNNTAVGYQALSANTTASSNTAVGYQAGYSNTTGTGNVFIGTAAGINVTTGTINTFIGSAIIGSTYSSGYFVTTGSKNSILGNYNGNQGGLDIRTASNYIVLSDGDGAIGAQYQTTAATDGWFQKNNSTAWSITSDARIKKNVVSLESGLDVISSLRPVEFDYIENDKHDIGFIAQEYQIVLSAQVAEGEDGMLSLTQNLVPYLVKAIQELHAEVQSLKQQLGK